MMIIITSDGGGWPLPHFLSEYCKHIYTQMQQRTDQGPVYCGQKMNYCFITRITSGDSEGCDLAVNAQAAQTLDLVFSPTMQLGQFEALLCPPFTIDKLEPTK